MNKIQTPAILIKNNKKEEIIRFENNGEIYLLGKKIDIAKDIAQAFMYTVIEISGCGAKELINKIIQEKFEADGFIKFTNKDGIEYIVGFSRVDPENKPIYLVVWGVVWKSSIMVMLVYIIIKLVGLTLGITW